jgi:hypothetical protein
MTDASLPGLSVLRLPSSVRMNARPAAVTRTHIAPSWS